MSEIAIATVVILVCLHLAWEYARNVRRGRR